MKPLGPPCIVCGTDDDREMIEAGIFFERGAARHVDCDPEEGAMSNKIGAHFATVSRLESWLGQPPSLPRCSGCKEEIPEGEKCIVYPDGDYIPTFCVHCVRRWMLQLHPRHSGSENDFVLELRAEANEYDFRGGVGPILAALLGTEKPA